MNASLMTLEIWVIALGIVLMLADFFFGVTLERKKALAYLGIAALTIMLLTLLGNDAPTGTAFKGAFVQDPLAIFFKRFFVVAAILVLFLTSEFSEKISASVSEFYSLVVFALAGMLFAASSNDFAMLFVSIELITVTFYVLVSYQRRKLSSLEAGVKYLIIGALSSAFMVFGIALIWGTTGQMNFTDLAAVVPQYLTNKIFLAGVLFLLTGLGFKISAVPFQIWAPDVYQGAPTPATAFLAVGSKAAGFVLLLRVLFTAVPDLAHHWSNFLIIISALTILYGNLCALPQRNLKRILGYSSISHAGYLLLGVSALSASGQSAVMYYLAGYLFTIVAAFTVICLVMQNLDDEDVSALAGLNQRSPLLATTMTFAMVSLAGLPPLAGFFGKLLLLKAVLAEGPANHGYYYLAFIALAGIVISFYYYFGVIRAIYWSKEPSDLSPIRLSGAAKFSIALCIGGMVWLGTFPNFVVNLADQAAKALK
jgi:NADH-quinone oxidoreductase subunit N